MWYALYDWLIRSSYHQINLFLRAFTESWAAGHGTLVICFWGPVLASLTCCFSYRATLGVEVFGSLLLLRDCCASPTLHVTFSAHRWVRGLHLLCLSLPSYLLSSCCILQNANKPAQSAKPVRQPEVCGCLSTEAVPIYRHRPLVNRVDPRHFGSSHQWCVPPQSQCEGPILARASFCLASIDFLWAHKWGVLQELGVAIDVDTAEPWGVTARNTSTERLGWAPYPIPDPRLSKAIPTNCMSVAAELEPLFERCLSSKQADWPDIHEICEILQSITVIVCSISQNSELLGSDSESKGLVSDGYDRTRPLSQMPGFLGQMRDSVSMSVLY